MSDLDIIEIPGYPGLFTRRIVVEMWQRAGSPRINDAGRLYSQQLAARLAFENGTGSPADDPRRPDRYPLAHVRFAALDVVNSARSAMIAAGFEYPYDYEPWHGQLPNIYAYPLVTSIPSSASDGSTAFPTQIAPLPEEEDEMKLIQATGRGIAIIGPAYFKSLTPEELPIATGIYGWPKDYGDNARAFDLAVSIAVNGKTADADELDRLEAGAAETIAALAKLNGPEVVDPPKA